MKKSTTLTWVLIGLAIIIAAFPMFFNLGNPLSKSKTQTTSRGSHHWLANCHPK